MSQDLVLIVEDNAEWQNILRSILEAAGFDCEVASDYPSSVRKLRSLDPLALVLDLKLGEGDYHDNDWEGWELARHAREQGISSVIVSGYAEPHRSSRAFREFRVVDFFDKGYLLEHKPLLVQRVAEAVENTRRRRAELEKARHRRAEPEEKTRCRFVLRYNRPSKLISATVEDEEGRRLFSADSPKELDIDVKSLSIRADEARYSSKWRTLIRGIGQDLYAKLFNEHPLVLQAYDRAKSLVNDQDESLSVVFSSTRDTLRLPVEFLHDGHDYLCLRHPMSRYLQELHSRPSLSQVVTAGKGLRVLFSASDTGGIPGVDREISALRKALPKLLSAQNVECDVTALPTSSASHKKIVQELEDCDYDIWHYAGHGSYNEDSPEQSFLVFYEKARRKGDRHVVTASDLQDLLKNSSLNFVYLSCCLGTASGSAEQLYNDDFLGLADALAEAKVAAIIGFRWPVSDEGAVAMAQAFYEAFCRDFSPRRALWLARRAVTREPHKRDDPTWASPVLIEQS